ncbi:sirohydrochlorin chelatase [Pandoraea pnomenusa]|uniref:Cobalamin biosynthesis protein CbiX n=1 Tax=Pandoraea pnomenusa TaxID=93220 RepID=A0A378YVG9_9BURK|nr:CbiX/SirB N-terminal domain-containing protein [Pandoraea pnomenusa]AHB07007.1 cobalamin biosynthesis protein CbiX [Pandoraea pnomenusa 3kgm]AHN74819.1 cobalamin biosynthesis protein CbiX [Pandoraea pnomenusa]AIU28666.1 cobalamin biosynthesis protein CbiX [Pandoraea pnomenusa]ANC45678.1 cobalamin biosynthesis protein CbiX [Pandoraea pnomenusa]MBN9094728.1 CbiX/SirB N-terminal domain-containing protein [Pandoraea pnomenusa]
MPDKPGLVLFAHGSRDPRWAEPFERLREMLRAQRPDVDVRLAFLELMTPSLAQVVDELAAAGSREITVVPIFLGQGAHARRDLPALVETCRTTHPALSIRLCAAAGESDTVLLALAAYCTDALDIA